MSKMVRKEYLEYLKRLAAGEYFPWSEVMRLYPSVAAYTGIKTCPKPGS